MGNIRPTYIKRVAIELMARFPNDFTENFDHNKVMVGKLTDVQYIGMRNSIAGYITRKIRRKKEE